MFDLLVYFFFFSEEPLSQFIVTAFLLHQFLVCPLLHNLPFVNQNDLVCPFNCFQPMCNH